MTNPNNNHEKQPIIVTRAAQTEAGAIYCLVTKGAKQLWISQTDMVLKKQEVLGELAKVGIALLLPKTISDLADQLENHPAPSSALVATQPGWLAEEVYVHPNGEVQKGANVDAEVLVAFVPDAAYGASGNLEEWQKELEPILDEQPFLVFGLCYAFSALLLARVQPVPLNPIVEIFGEKEAGKSVVGSLFGSVVGGDPNSGVGIGRTADGTSAGFKQIQRMASDTLLFLDETNILDKAVEDNLRLFFSHTSRDERVRFGEAQRTAAIRNSLLITGNERLANRTKTSSPILAAAQSRCLSIDVGADIVASHKHSEAEHRKWFINLINASNINYGTAGRAYIENIIKEVADDSERFASRVGKRMERFLEEMPPAAHLSQRIKTTIALAFTAGTFAYEWDIWPSEKKMFFKSCRTVYESANAQATLDATFKTPGVKRVLDTIVANQYRIAVIQPKTGRVTWKGSQPPIGYMWKHSGATQRFFFEANTLRNALGAYSATDLKALKQEGFIKSEGGRQSRLDIKPPVSVPIDGRGYEIHFPLNMLEMAGFRCK